MAAPLYATTSSSCFSQFTRLMMPPSARQQGGGLFDDQVEQRVAFRVLARARLVSCSAVSGLPVGRGSRTAGFFDRDGCLVRQGLHHRDVALVERRSIWSLLTSSTPITPALAS